MSGRPLLSDAAACYERRPRSLRPQLSRMLPLYRRRSAFVTGFLQKGTVRRLGRDSLVNARPSRPASREEVDECAGAGAQRAPFVVDHMKVSPDF